AAAVPLDDLARGETEVAGPRVVAEPGPVAQYLVEGRGGQVRDLRKRFHEAQVIGNDGSHLSLLQHDLGDPHAVRVAVLLPGQVLAPVHIEPREQLRRETVVAGHGVGVLPWATASMRSMASAPSARSVRLMM